MEVDDYHFCELLRMEPVARMPDEDLLHSEVAIMSGGRDQSGRPLVTFPAQNHGILESRVMGSGLDRILQYYINITSPTTKVHGFAFIADLRFSTLDFISMLKSSLNSLQAETSSVVGPFVLYLIQPIDKKSLKDTQTLLALRQSKKKSNKHIASTLFQTIMVVDEMDLYNHVDKSQLTADLGGYLQYSHSAWVRFRKTVEPFFLRYEEVIPKLPDAFSRLDELESFDLGGTREDLERQKENIQQLLKDLFRELGLETLNQQCDDLLSKINQSDADEVFAAVAQKPVFREVRLLAEYCREKLTMMQQRLDAAKERVEGRVKDEMKRLDLSEDVQNLSNWLLNEGPTGLKRLEIADSLGRAEMLCNHFETGVASLALDKLALAESLQEHVQTLISEGSNGFTDLRSAVRDLEGHAEKYQSMLDDRRHLLSTVRNFYGLYDKIERWWGKALKFLPHDTVDIQDDIRSERTNSRRRKDIGDVGYQWIEDVERFLRKHHPPKDEDVTTMTEYAETIGERAMKKNAKSLSNRCNTLLRVLNTNDLASEKDVHLAMKWRSKVVGSHGDGHRERTKGVTHERKEGDGVEETRMKAEKEREMESEVDDPLLRRIGRHTPSRDLDVRGQRSKRRSSKGKVDEKVEDRKNDSDGRRMKVDDEEKKNDDVPKEVKGDERKEKDRDERGNEREQSQWIRPSQDFWAGRIPGVVRQNQSQTDEMDGKMEDHYDNVGMSAQDNHSHMAGRLAGRLPASNQTLFAMNSPHLSSSTPGELPHYLNRNQNANPSPSYVDGRPLHTLHGIAIPPHHMGQLQGMSSPIDQLRLGNFQTGQSQFFLPGLNQSPYSIPSRLSDLASRQHAQVADAAAQTCTLYDPVTGLPYQAYIQSPRSSSLQGDPRPTDYLSDSCYSNPGTENHRRQRQVDPHISGMHALQALVGHPEHRVTSQERMHALNIGLSSMQDTLSRSSTPHSEHKRELSPYEDVLNRIGQMRARARRKKNSQDKIKTQSAEMHAARSVPNLSNLLAGVHIGGVGNGYGDGDVDVDGDDQSNYYTRLAHLEDQTGSRSSEHATKKWVSRLVADDLHFADSSSLRSASPALPSSIVKNGHRPLTPQEQYELESLTSILNESDDDNDDSAPVSNSPTRDQFRRGDTSPGRRVLPARPQNIDFDADQRELDQIRQNLSGSYAATSNHDLGTNYDSLQTTQHSPSQHHSSFSSSEISPLHYPSAYSTEINPHPANQPSHAVYHPANHSSASFAAASHGRPSYTSHHQSKAGSFHSGGVSSIYVPSAGSKGTTLAPMTEQLRDYFGDVGVTEEELVQQGLEDRLRNVHVNQERVTHDHLSTPNFLAEAMDTLVKLDSVDSQLPPSLPLEARHVLQRNPSLQLSDEGVIIDGASWDGTLEAGSAATTERGSVESGVGSRGRASNP